MEQKWDGKITVEQYFIFSRQRFKNKGAFRKDYKRKPRVYLRQSIKALDKFLKQIKHGK